MKRRNTEEKQRRKLNLGERERYCKKVKEGKFKRKGDK
jgi:hypothetical protein